MIKKIVAVTSILMLLSANLFAADITTYGAFNYKFSHDENSSGVAYNKLQDNGSKIGIDLTEPSIDGSLLGAFAKLEVGVDTDDAASDTFDSRLAYVGLSHSAGSLSVGRQSHPFTDNVGGKTNIFNVYGSNADQSYATRSSQSLAFSTSLSNITVDTLAIVDGSSSNTDAFDEFEGTVSATLLGSDISVGYADDVNNDVTYYGAGATTVVGPVTLGTSYTVKDNAGSTADVTGIEATASISLFTIGYQDLESTGNYYTVGVAKDLTPSVKVYAEGQLSDLDSGTDTQSWSLGAKYSF
jgi:hypothetical protein